MLKFNVYKLVFIFINLGYESNSITYYATNKLFIILLFANSCKYENACASYGSTRSSCSF